MNNMDLAMKEHVVWGSMVRNYSSVVAMTFVVCDWISSAREEAEQIWTRPWTNLKSLYVFMRLLSVGTLLFLVTLALQPSLNSSRPLPEKTCREILGFQTAANLALMFAIQVILLMRVEALYQDKTFLRRFLRALYLAETIMATFLSIFEVPKITYDPSCLAHFPMGFSTVAFLLPMLFEFILFALTMVKFYGAVRDGWGRQPLIFRFLQDGIWAFGLPFVMLMINTVCTVRLPGTLSSVAYSWLLAIPGFAGCRLILNLSHLLRSGRTYDPATCPDQDSQFDTQPLSHQRTGTPTFGETTRSSFLSL